ncbi:uncharacterized protein HMPREF1541_06502 [Cyphellophora europaea CBS 101466]|uniref:Uncharacterized protein n=1 Tax=Cyphellophora europaea (strain CBS 101466) TaxID=1220924 RepID=W2RPS8_CYPE1|nr:uncharacterized protein HMPREF1541_06502 [Cyphellophora europaea CBS 101466]ETN38467.1 hypothetical protein HMPREF1541_06502 [Cyphellophora europaea CBS 101466]
MTDSESSMGEVDAQAQEVLDQRKWEYQDFMSSFDRDVLPSEWQTELMSRITLPESRTEQRNWTSSADYLFTMAQWACYQPERDILTLFGRMKSLRDRAITFKEKLLYRSEANMREYKEGVVAVEAAAENMEELMGKAALDREHRQHESLRDEQEHDRQILGVLVRLLADISDPGMDPRARTTRRDRVSGTCLFSHLLQQRHRGDFMLDLMAEIVESTGDNVGVEAMRQDVREIHRNLDRYGAHDGYKIRFHRMFRDIVG